MTTAVRRRTTRHRRHTTARLIACAVTTDGCGFGYSREPDTDLIPAEVPDGVELVFINGRTPRRAA